MSLRFFEGEDHAKVYVQYRPTPPEELINRLVEFIREKYDGPLTSAVDLGCGNGQCTFALAKHFTSVIGTDISPAQISEATELCAQEKKYENVKFLASSAEQIPVPDGSVQLITICEAAHWMDLPKVYEEARRVLAKHGVFAIIGYHLPEYTPVTSTEDLSKANAIQEVLQKGIDRTKDYWPKEVIQVLTEYPDVVIPFSENVRERGFSHTRTARKISDILGCIRTYSPFVSYDKAEKTGDKLLDDIGNGIVSILNEGREKELTPEEIKAYEFTETFNYFVLMARI